MQVTRLVDGPIVHPGTHPSIGVNIQGPSLVRVPAWVTEPLGAYYLYFADHKGTYIRLATADRLAGPWRIHPPGSLDIADSRFPTEPPTMPDNAQETAESRRQTRSHGWVHEATTPHIASPDVHIDMSNQQFVMYFHGLARFDHQATRVATSVDGIRFTAHEPLLGRTYFRVFRYQDWVYALAMPGQFYRARSWLGPFESGPRLFNPDMRHSAVRVVDTTLEVFWTQVGEAPERILRTTIDLKPQWRDWTLGTTSEVLRPERDWEGADQPLEPSIRSTAYGRVNQLRDPALFEEDGRLYLLYAVAGESGIAVAEIRD
ncbi:MAG: hypothetical protein AAF493_20105 [Pseudomonadota bacterium]